MGVTDSKNLSNKYSKGGGEYFLIRGYWGCAAGWSRIFTTGLTIMGSRFELLVNGVAHF